MLRIVSKTSVFDLALIFIWISTILAFTEDKENKVLLVLSNGKTFSLREALKQNATARPYNRKDELSNSDLSKGYFGSSLLERWEQKPPRKVTLLLTNSFEQIFSYAVFNTINTNSSGIENWFLTENLQQIPGALKLHAHSKLSVDYPVAITPASDQRKAVFAIRYANPTYSYITSTDHTSAFSLYEKRQVDLSFLDCSEVNGLAAIAMDDFNTNFMDSMTVGLCSEHCWDLGHHMSGLRNGTQCYCVQSKPVSSSPHHLCAGPCAGNKLTESCGTKNHMSIYHINFVEELRARSFQETRNSVTFNESAPVTSLDDIKISLGDFPRYVTSIKLNITSLKGASPDPDSGEFHLAFSNESCDENTYTMYMINDTIQVFTVNTVHELEVLKVRCFYLTEFNLQFKLQFKWQFGITELTDDYIFSPFLVLKGHYPSQGTSRTTTSVSEIATEATRSRIPSSEQTVASDDVSVISTSDDYIWPKSSANSASCCFCDCSMYSAYSRWQSNNESDATSVDFKSITLQLKQENAVNKTTLSAYTRMKTSAPDPRPSSKGIGCVGIVILITAITFIVAIDLSHIKTYILLMRDKIKNCK